MEVTHLSTKEAYLSGVNELQDKHDTLNCCGAPSCRRKVDMSMVTSMLPSNSHVRCQDGDAYEVHENVGDKAEDGDMSQVYLYHCLPPYTQHSYEPHVDYYPGIL